MVIMIKKLILTSQLYLKPDNTYDQIVDNDITVISEARW